MAPNVNDFLSLTHHQDILTEVYTLPPSQRKVRTYIKWTRLLRHLASSCESCNMPWWSIALLACTSWPHNYQMELSCIIQQLRGSERGEFVHQMGCKHLFMCVCEKDMAAINGEEYSGTYDQRTVQQNVRQVVFYYKWDVEQHSKWPQCLMVKWSSPCSVVFHRRGLKWLVSLYNTAGFRLGHVCSQNGIHLCIVYKKNPSTASELLMKL